MIAEAIERIKDIIREGMTAKVLQVPGPDWSYVIQNPADDTIERVNLDPELSFAATDVPSFLGILKTILATDIGSDKPTMADVPVVYVENAQVCAVLGAAERVKLVLPLPSSDELECLEEKSGEWFDHRHFVNLLRDQLPTPPEILSKIRSLKAKQSAASASDIQTRNESMGREVNRSVLGGDGEEIPETVTFAVRPFAPPTMAKAGTVECSIDITYDPVAFRLVPLFGQTDAIKIAGLDQLVAELGSGVPEGWQVLRGAVRLK